MEGSESPPPLPHNRSFNLSASPPPSPLALYSFSSSSPLPDNAKSSPSSSPKPKSPTPSTSETPADDTANVTEEPPAAVAGKDATQSPNMVNQFFKLLLRKHSSGDLHSRLKTRKLLGVGETDDGDIHRSKLSQILGHSDQLYIRLPYGLRIWQMALALMFSVVGAWAVLFPSHLFASAAEVGDGDHVTYPVRLYGGALLSLSLVFWMTVSSQDRDTIRMCLLASIVYFSIQIIVTIGHLLVYSRSADQCYNLLVLLATRAFFALTSAFYHWALTQRKFCAGGASSSSLRRNTSSGKDLGAAGGSGSGPFGTGVGGGGGGGGGFGVTGSRAVTTATLYNGVSGCNSSGFAVGGGGGGSGGDFGDGDDAGAAGAGIIMGDSLKNKDV